MRRWTLLLAGAALWLFLAAIPALADGGPHVAKVNNGSGGLTADSCAGCHRAHTAQGLYLLVGEDGPALCLVCHGKNGFGATTDVETGLQYTPAGADGRERGAPLGASRSGGFLQARIASGSAYAIHYLNTDGEVRRNTKVPVGDAAATTSAHLPIVDGEISSGTATAWGYGANSLTPNPGVPVTMECVTCHNPHGNEQYRILRAFTADDITETLGTQIAALAEPGKVVADNPDATTIAKNDARNYTVIQTNPSTGTLLASQVTALSLPATAGDYFRRRVPWNDPGGASDRPNGLSSFTTAISQWCLTCHQRYLSAGWDVEEADGIYKYRHTSVASSRNCITCHVAHGSNAQMKEFNSQHVAFPDNIVGGVFDPVSDTASLDSRLLKFDNRGTCQGCHDPTGTSKVTDIWPTGATAPVPLVP